MYLVVSLLLALFRTVCITNVTNSIHCKKTREHRYRTLSYTGSFRHPTLTNPSELNIKMKAPRWQCWYLNGGAKANARTYLHVVINFLENLADGKNAPLPPLTYGRKRNVDRLRTMGGDASCVPSNFNSKMLAIIMGGVMALNTTKRKSQHTTSPNKSTKSTA